MLKKLGLPLVALAAMLAFGAPKPAEAKVHFGVVIGTPPPVYNPYCSAYDPYNCVPYGYAYPYGAYAYPYTYPAPYVYGGWGWHGEGHEHDFREHDRDRDRGFRGRHWEHRR